MLETATERYLGLLQKLNRLNPLADADKEAILALTSRMETVRGQSWVIREGDAITECCLLIEGYACRHKRARN